MKNRIISLLIVAMLVMLMALPVSAAQSDYVLDEFDLLLEEEVEEITDLAEEISGNYGVDVFFAMTYEDLESFDVNETFFQTSNYIALIQDEEYWDILVEGTPEAVVGSNEVDELWDAYNQEDTYVGGAVAFYEAVEDLLAQAGDVAPAVPGEETEEYIIRLLDEAELLSSSEAKKLLEKLDETSKELKFDIIIVTMDDFGGGNVERFTEDFYDSVYGSGRNGVILLVSMEDRDWCISGNAEGKDIFTSANNEAIADAITPYLAEGEYADAFNEFVDQCVYYIDGERNGYPFDSTTSLLVALVAGLLVAAIATGIMKGQLKSVRMQRAAQNYMKPGSMQLTYANDFYLYRTVDRTRRANDSSSGSGGSGSHSTSSGKF